MKENWINKLIELLNESEDWFVSKFVSYDDEDWVFILNSWQSFHYTFILSKEYRFIQRLVENDKIHCWKVIWEYWKTVWAKFISEPIQYNDFECICLMLLSIQDNPIEFLLSILK